MPPRSGQLDQISQAIGKLEGRFDGVEQYMHEREHGINNLSQKVDGLRVSIGKDIATVEARIGEQIKAMDGRIAALEAAAAREAGAKSLAAWVLQSPLIGWIAAGLMLFIAWWKKP
jgi:septal ring factor EnvC (AmiA/AmiB activator)